MKIQSRCIQVKRPLTHLVATVTGLVSNASLCLNSFVIPHFWSHIIQISLDRSLDFDTTFEIFDFKGWIKVKSDQVTLYHVVNYKPWSSTWDIAICTAAWHRYNERLYLFPDWGHRTALLRYTTIQWLFIYLTWKVRNWSQVRWTRSSVSLTSMWIAHDLLSPVPKWSSTLNCKQFIFKLKTFK
jgi:hypothetical protein